MYTGRPEKPCCLCDRSDTPHRIDVPPRALTSMKNAGPIAWQDVEGEVSLFFCENDWGLVRDLVLETGLNPLSRCNAARASFSLREDYEAYLNATRDQPDHAPLERRMLEEARETVARYEAGDDMVEPRDLVEARIVEWTVEDEESTETRTDGP
ncbi:hypothetical protein AArcSl_2441 [Halalkaliarchaeum desulfuricum]|uniref:DUF7960 domain-containing protein n=1 Tax=Halalkaliarchaeum desulfuricum TaxID=2055893 RepID=A0A343TLU1_9EURY|nr:hypothetical protein [Halalkaliarchaeum desulfuricum]AUX10063.1 hypothetical protein AArcSl_2441 [Halalkaliarchaeum desulfuricum]